MAFAFPMFVCQDHPKGGDVDISAWLNTGMWPLK
jgi:hypothetical protein